MDILIYRFMKTPLLEGSPWLFLRVWELHYNSLQLVFTGKGFKYPRMMISFPPQQQQSSTYTWITLRQFSGHVSFTAQRSQWDFITLKGGVPSASKKKIWNANWKNQLAFHWKDAVFYFKPEGWGIQDSFIPSSIFSSVHRTFQVPKISGILTYMSCV